MKKLMLSVFALAAFVLNVAAQANTATVSGVTGSAELITPMSLSKVTSATNNGNLEFGKIAIGAGSGTVVLSAAASPTVTPSGSATLVAGTTRSAAAFLVAGQTGRTYSVTLPGTTNVTSGSNNLTIDTWTSSASNTIAATESANTFYVAGTLNIPADSPVGNYTGTFNVTVTYN